MYGETTAARISPGKGMMTTTESITDDALYWDEELIPASNAPTTKTDVPDGVADQVEAGRGTIQYAQIPAWVLFAASPQAVKAYGLLKLCVRPGSTRAAPTRDHLARIAGLTKAQNVVRYTDELRDIGAIDKRTVRTGMKQRTIYTVHWDPPKGYAGPVSKSEWMDREFPKDD